MRCAVAAGPWGSEARHDGMHQAIPLMTNAIVLRLRWSGDGGGISQKHSTRAKKNKGRTLVTVD